MNELISERQPIARKDHFCMAQEFIFETDFVSCDGTIKKGEKYIKQTIKGDSIYTFKAHISCHDICLEEGLYHD